MPDEKAGALEFPSEQEFGAARQRAADAMAAFMERRISAKELREASKDLDAVNKRAKAALKAARGR